MSIRVLLCDDHPLLREGLRTLIAGQDDIELVAEAADGEVAIMHAQQFKPDVVVMDMSLPKLNGALATVQIKKMLPDTKVLALTVHAGKSYLRQFFEAGANGYALKNTANDEFIRAIHAVAEGKVYIDPALSDLVVSRIVKDSKNESLPGGPALSEREEQVAKLLAQGYTNKEIAEDLEVSVKTVETYKARALEKIGVQTRAQLVRFGIRKGWLEEEEGISSVP
jgi:two-component system, NarL family, response regulator NreC